MAIFILTTDLQRKAFLHPIRSKILDFLVVQPMTITGVAKELGVHPANITHHFKALLGARLIKIVEERDTGRVIEKYYSAVAKAFEIKQETKGANAKVLAFLKNDLSATIPKLKPDDADLLIGLIKRSKISPKTFHEFAEKLSDLIEEFSSKDEPGLDTYALNVSLYPHSVDYGPLRKIEITKKGKKKV